MRFHEWADNGDDILEEGGWKCSENNLRIAFQRASDVLRIFEIVEENKPKKEITSVSVHVHDSRSRELEAQRQ